MSPMNDLLSITQGGQDIPANSLFQNHHSAVMQIWTYSEKKTKQKIRQLKLKIVSHAYECAQLWNFLILDCLTLKPCSQSL